MSVLPEDSRLSKLRASHASEIVKAALIKHGGNRNRACKELGISPDAIRARIRRYRLEQFVVEWKRNGPKKP